MYLTQTLHRTVQQDPQRLLTIYGDRARTAVDSADRTAHLAGGLRSVGVADGDRVAILSLNSDRYHEYLLACPWAGAVVTPLNSRWSVPEIGYALHDSSTRVLFVDEAYLGLVPAIRGHFDGLATVVVMGDGEPAEGMVGYEQLIARSAAVAENLIRPGKSRCADRDARHGWWSQGASYAW